MPKSHAAEENAPSVASSFTEPPASGTRAILRETPLGASGLPCLADPVDELTSASGRLFTKKTPSGTKQYDFSVPGTPPARVPPRPRAPDPFLLKKAPPEVTVEVVIEDDE